MFPWLKPENENYAQNQKQKADYRQNDSLGNYARYANRQNQSEQDLMKAQKIQFGRQESTEERKNYEKEQNAYNHSRSENKLNQEKYNPFYDNQLSYNLKLNSRSGRGRNSQTPKSPKDNTITFDQDYKHQIIEKNKQDYKNYYRDNVSEFQKKQQGASIKSLEDKKQILQQQYGKESTGLHQRMSENARTSVSPQQKQKEYAETLKKQIEEKKEFQKQRQRKEEELDFQNNNQYFNDYQSRQSPFKYQQQQPQNYQNFENKKQPSKKNVGFEDQRNDVQDNYKSEVDYEALAKANNYRESYNSPQEGSKPRRQSNGDNYNPRNEDFEEYYKSQNQQENRRQSRQQKANFENDIRFNNKRVQDEEDQQNIIGQIYDKDARERELKKQREYQYYKQLEEEIAYKKDRRASNQAPTRSQNEKSMLDQLGENYNRQQELKQLNKEQIANDLQQQIKEKKRLQRIEKEKQDLLDRQYEEKVKSQVNELKAKYEIEIQGKQHEIKSLRKNLEKKKQEQLQKQGEMVLSKSKSPPKNKVENSPRATQNKYEESFNQYQNSESQLQEQNQMQAEEQDNNNEYGKRQFNDVLDDYDRTRGHDIHQQARDLRQQKRHEDRERYRDQQFDKQSQYYSNMEINKEWNPPQFWQYKERKNMEELTKLKEQLDMQTSLLQNEVTKIKQDAQIANEMKSQAFIDLENLKDSLKRQNMIENIKLRELKQNLGNLGYVQNDFLPPSSHFQGQYASGGNQILTANNILQNQQPLNLGSTRNYNQLNQSAFSQNFNNSQLGLSNIYGNNSFNNNLSSNKYGIQQPDILDKLISSNVNVYKFEGTKLNNKPTTLDFKLEKRLNNVNLNKAEVQLLEVDNLLNNLRNGL